MSFERVKTLNLVCNTPLKTSDHNQHHQKLVYLLHIFLVELLDSGIPSSYHCCSHCNKWYWRVFMDTFFLAPSLSSNTLRGRCVCTGLPSSQYCSVNSFSFCLFVQCWNVFPRSLLHPKAADSLNYWTIKYFTLNKTNWKTFPCFMRNFPCGRKPDVSINYHRKRGKGEDETFLLTVTRRCLFKSPQSFGAI